MLGFCCHLQEAQKHSDQLQKQLDRKVTEVESLQHKLTSRDAELGKFAKAKKVNAQVSCKRTMFDRFDQVFILRPFHTWGLGNLQFYGYI